jgi:hypothetical protein
MLDGASHIGQLRWLLGGPQHHDSGQRLEPAVIPFGIDNAKAVVLQNHLLAKKTSDPGLARLRFPDDQDICPGHIRGDRASVVLGTDRERVASDATNG